MASLVPVELMRVLIVDDERSSRVTTAHQLRGAGYEAQIAANAFEALAALREEPFDVVLTDLRMPGKSGVELLQEIREAWPETDVLVMTAYGSVETAVKALKEGAADYLQKPFPFAALEARLRRLEEHRSIRRQLVALEARVAESSAAELGIVGTSQEMAIVRERTRLFAGHDAPVLITGETGTGKDLVARAIHSQGGRAERPLIVVPCGAIPRDLAESELFGHERGAFTGAHQAHPGLFQRADGGTLVLDDVDDLGVEIQAKLLRAIQDGRFTRVGGAKEISVDTRIIATTKRDLGECVDAGDFRSDLYYRLRGLEIHVPPLRARTDDILPLARHFLEHASTRAGAEAPRLSPEAARMLLAHRWPGNVRELRSAMEAAPVLSGGREIQPRHLPEALLRPEHDSERLFTLLLDGCERLDLRKLLRQVEQRAIDWAMEAAGGNQVRAAELLGIPRTTLQSRLERLD